MLVKHRQIHKKAAELSRRVRAESRESLIIIKQKTRMRFTQITLGTFFLPFLGSPRSRQPKEREQRANKRTGGGLERPRECEKLIYGSKRLRAERARRLMGLLWASRNLIFRTRENDLKVCKNYRFVMFAFHRRDLARGGISR
jgi:hypothetical protein